MIDESVFEAGILDRTYHDRLLLNLDGFCKRAGVPQQFVLTRLNQYCTPKEVEWVRALRRPTKFGLCFTGKSDAEVLERMLAIGGACLRNYIDSRVMSVQTVLGYLKADNMPTPTVLLIPNFYLEKDEGGDQPSWLVSYLLGMLYSRLGSSLKTVIYVQDLNGLGKRYGAAFKAHIEAHYEIIAL